MTEHLDLPSATPYANLSPDLILTAIDSMGYRCSGSLCALNSYENRVYQVGLEDAGFIIAKFYRPQRWRDEAILEEHQFAQELVDLEIPVVAPLATAAGKTLHEYQGYRFALFPRQGGRAFEVDDLNQLEWLGRFMGRIHAVGDSHRFKYRGQLDINSHGYQPSQFLLAHDFIPDDYKNNYRDGVASALEKVERCFKQVGTIATLRLHGDCHPGNVLWTDAGPHLVDLDDCIMGPAIQDMWMLLSGDREQMQIQLQRFLDGYYEFCEFNPREIHLIEALRTLRMIHYSAWLAKRWGDPAFPLNFPWFNTPTYWQQQLQHLAEQIILLDHVIELI